MKIGIRELKQMRFSDLILRNTDIMIRHIISFCFTTTKLNFVNLEIIEFKVSKFGQLNPPPIYLIIYLKIMLNQYVQKFFL